MELYGVDIKERRALACHWIDKQPWLFEKRKYAKTFVKTHFFGLNIYKEELTKSNQDTNEYYPIAEVKTNEYYVWKLSAKCVKKDEKEWKIEEDTEFLYSIGPFMRGQRIEFVKYGFPKHNVIDERITYEESFQLFLILFCGTSLFCKLACDITPKNIKKEFKKLQEENPEPWGPAFDPFMRRLWQIAILGNPKPLSLSLACDAPKLFFHLLFPHMLLDDNLQVIFFLYDKLANRPFGFINQETLDRGFTFWEQAMLDMSAETIAKRVKH